MCLMKKNETGRVMAFVDVRNVIKGLQKTREGFSRVDFETMVEELVGGRKLVAAYAFDGMPNPKNPDACAAFHKHLQMEGFRLRLRDSYDSENHAQKQVDMAMGIEMVLQAKQDNFDVAIIVSGDSDFVPALEAMQAMGKTVEVAAFDRCCGAPLRRGADIYTKLDTLPIAILEAPACEEEAEEEEEIADSASAEDGEAA